MKSKVLLGLGLVVLLAMGSSLVGQSTAEVLKAKIDFPFMAGKANLPAGEYTFTAENNDEIVRVQGEGKNAAIVNVITRTSGMIHSTPQDAHLVFDVIGDMNMLAEMWIPGADGFVLAVTKGKHEHKVVNIQK